MGEGLPKANSFNAAAEGRGEGIASFSFSFITTYHLTHSLHLF